MSKSEATIKRLRRIEGQVRGVIKMLVVELLGMPTANVSRLNTGGNTCVTEFSFSAGPPRLVRFADASHLD